MPSFMSQTQTSCNLSIYLPVCLSACLSNHPSIYPSIYPPTHLSIYLLLLLAHLSQKLIGELIVYQWSGVRRRPSVVVRRPQCSNIFFLGTTWQIKAKFYVEPPWVGGTKFCSRHLGHETNMRPSPYMVKTLKKIPSPEPAGRFS